MSLTPTAQDPASKPELEDIVLRQLTVPVSNIPSISEDYNPNQESIPDVDQPSSLNGDQVGCFQ